MQPARLPADPSLVRLTAVRSQGAGGQNVNKVATAVQLEYRLAEAGLPERVRRRVEKLAGSRLDGEGVIHIRAQEFRTQEANRRAAMRRLQELLDAALPEPVRRIPTRPTKGSVRRRLEDKRRQAFKKRLRGPGDMM